MWIDQKRHVRKKLTENKKNRNKTGGGPNREYVFSSNEEAIIDLLSLEESIGGLDVDVFGIPVSSAKRKNAEMEDDVDAEQHATKKTCGTSEDPSNAKSVENITPIKNQQKKAMWTRAQY